MEEDGNGRRYTALTVAVKLTEALWHCSSASRTPEEEENKVLNKARLKSANLSEKEW